MYRHDICSFLFDLFHFKSFTICFLLIQSTHALGYTMEGAGISDRAQDYVDTMEFSETATNHVAFQNCLRDIISTETVPIEAVEISSEAQLSQIQPGGTPVVVGTISGYTWTTKYITFALIEFSKDHFICECSSDNSSLDSDFMFMAFGTAAT